MPAQGQADMAVILDHFMARGHRLERDGLVIGLRRRLAFGRREQRQRNVAQRLDRP